jgi:ABC-type lipoprotein release transport system permease subunit
VQGLLYEVSPYDPVTFAAVSGVLLVVVFVACVIPARRASAVPPADALRAE